MTLLLNEIKYFFISLLAGIGIVFLLYLQEKVFQTNFIRHAIIYSVTIWIIGFLFRLLTYRFKNISERDKRIIYINQSRNIDEKRIEAVKERMNRTPK